MHLVLRESSRVQRYRFATRTADFLICQVCGVFVAACMAESRLAVVNVNVLDVSRQLLTNPIKVVDLNGEWVEQRFARRKAGWTPVLSFVSDGVPAPP